MTSMVFERCRAKQIRLNPVKIELKKASMPYIGHVLTSEGVQAEPGKVKAILEMMLANTLSRHHLEHTTDNTQGDEQVDSLETISEILLCESTVTTLRDHALHDEELQQVQSFIQSGWPASPKDLEPIISPNFHIRVELAIPDGIIFREGCIVNRYEDKCRVTYMQHIKESHRQLEGLGKLSTGHT